MKESEQKKLIVLIRTALRRGNVADLSVISACDVLIVSGGSGKLSTISGNMC